MALGLLVGLRLRPLISPTGFRKLVLALLGARRPHRHPRRAGGVNADQTLDRALADAARAAGLTVLPERTAAR